MQPVKSEEDAKAAKAAKAAESVYNTNSRIVVAIWIMREAYTSYHYQVGFIELTSKEATKKRRKEVVLNFQKSKRSRLDGEEEIQIQGTFKHFMCGECFKPLANGVIPDEHTCKCV